MANDVRDYRFTVRPIANTPFIVRTNRTPRDSAGVALIGFPMSFRRKMSERASLFANETGCSDVIVPAGMTLLGCAYDFEQEATHARVHCRDRRVQLRASEGGNALADLRGCAQWLIEQDVEEVVMESPAQH